MTMAMTTTTMAVRMSNAIGCGLEMMQFYDEVSSMQDHALQSRLDIHILSTELCVRL